MVLQLTCEGTPYQIGRQHGEPARELIARSLAFYADLFRKFSNKEWADVRKTATAFEAEVQMRWPAYHEEMRGIAEGAGVDMLDIVALNVRTEIAFGQFSDGCTSVAWKTGSHSFLGQNWDWMLEQKENLVLMTVRQPGHPTIKTVTEAGMLGKIGFNAHGVGVCFNAIRARGVATMHLPVHLGLRTVLESESADAAVRKLEEAGLAASGHFLIADADKAVGFEFTHGTIEKIQPVDGRVYHTNHLIVPHVGVQSGTCFETSEPRYERMVQLAGELQGRAGGEPAWEEFGGLFEDASFAKGICRQADESGIATLFRIVMDLRARRAVVSMGEPCRVEEEVEWKFD